MDADEIDAAGRVITVPLINFHEHFYSRLAKGLPVQGPMDNFYHVLENLWWKLDKALDLEMVRASAQLGAMESIRNGVTYIFDHHASPNATNESLISIAHVLQNYGLRGVLCFETSDRNGSALAQQALDEFQNFSDNHLTSDIKSMVGLHASFTLSDATLQQASTLIRNYGTGIHIHLCEDELDKEQSVKLYGQTPIARLSRYDLLNSKSILAHGVYLADADYSIILKTKSALAYNPDSNLNNTVGLPQFYKTPKRIPILIGTDGMHANIARSMKQIFLLYRHQKNKSDEAISWIQKIYFNQLDFIRNYFPDFSRLAIRDRADLILWDYIPPTPFSITNFWGHFIYGMLEYPIHSVLQNGRFLMKNRMIEKEDEIKKNIFKSGERLFEKFEISPN